MSLFSIGADAHARYRGRMQRRAITSRDADSSGEAAARARKPIGAEPAIVAAEGADGPVIARRLSSSLLDGLQSLASAPAGDEAEPAGPSDQSSGEAVYQTLADFTKRMA